MNPVEPQPSGEANFPGFAVDVIAWEGHQVHKFFAGSCARFVPVGHGRPQVGKTQTGAFPQFVVWDGVAMSSQLARDLFEDIIRQDGRLRGLPWLKIARCSVGRIGILPGGTMFGRPWR